MFLSDESGLSANEAELNNVKAEETTEETTEEATDEVDTTEESEG